MERPAPQTTTSRPASMEASKSAVSSASNPLSSPRLLPPRCANRPLSNEDAEVRILPPQPASAVSCTCLALSENYATFPRVRIRRISLWPRIFQICAPNARRCANSLSSAFSNFRFLGVGVTETCLLSTETGSIVANPVRVPPKIGASDLGGESWNGSAGKH